MAALSYGILLCLLTAGLAGTLHAQPAANPATAEKPTRQAAEPAHPDRPAPLVRLPGYGIPQGVVIRTTENVTKGGWVYVLNRCEELGIRRVDLLVKQDEDHFQSVRTGATLQSGELLVPLPDEPVAAGWEDDGWLREMMADAKRRGIEIWAWWPCFHDSVAAAKFPEAAYNSPRGEHFVDPGDSRVRKRQAELLYKLLDRYPFDGVSLDWVRYEGWYSGSKGPVGRKFSQIYQFEWGENALDNEYSKARWYEIRAQLIADWVAELVAGMRIKRPQVRWGAFLLPWQFSEVSQSYPLLGRSGLDYLQPMCYWRDWQQPPTWVGDRTLEMHREVTNGTAQWATLGIDAPVEEIDRALKSIASGSVAGLSWFTFGTWEEKTFRRVREVTTLDQHNNELFGFSAPQQPETPRLLGHYQWREEPQTFPGGTSLWAVVVLSELHRRHALPENTRIVPVLSFHNFNEGKKGEHLYIWQSSTDFLDELFDFIEESGFQVTPLSRFQSYLITGDPSFLPRQPLVLTVDDSHKSIVPHFVPRAVKRKFPFTIAAVTGQMDEASAGKRDSSITWEEAKEISATGLAEFISHSDNTHFLTAESPHLPQEHPGETTRQYLLEYHRRETTEEYRRRIRLDMITSRIKLAQHGLRAPTIFCWPYGQSNTSATAIGREAGFTHFLYYKVPPGLATWHGSRQGVPRVPVQVQDEEVPLKFPDDPNVQQRWWLAFLKIAISSRSPALIQSTLDQLHPENRSHPEAELAAAALALIRGDAASGAAKLEHFRARFEGNQILIQRAWDLLKEYDSPPK